MKKLVFTLIISFVSIAIFSQNVGDTFYEGRLRYEITSLEPKETAVIGRDPLFFNFSLIIVPEQARFYTVTSIANRAISNNTNLERVTLPATITSIGESAFANNNLNSINIPGNVTRIGKNAFANNSLTSVNIPSNITILDTGVFNNNSLESITIPNGVTLIGDNAFANNNLKSINIPDSVFEIGTKAFEKNNITHLDMPKNSTFFGDKAFFENPITSITSSREIPPFIVANLFSNVGNIDLTVTSLKARSNYKNATIWQDFKSISSDGSKDLLNDTFSDDGLNYRILSKNPKTLEVTGSENNTTTINIPDKLQDFYIKNIRFEAFQNKGITHVTLSSTITNVGEKAFFGNPINTVTSLNPLPPALGSNAFSNTNNIELTVNSSKIKNSYQQDQGWKNFKNFISSGISDELNDTFFVDNLNYKITSLAPKKVELLGRNNSDVNITIPMSADGFTVTNIVDSAFENDKLTNILIPNSITHIGNKAFKDNLLERVTLPNTLETIETSVFENNKLTDISIPNTVNLIKSGAFKNNLFSSFQIPITIEIIETSVLENNQLASIDIPSNIIQIKESAFKNNKLTSITIPNTLTKIGPAAFKDNLLATISLPNTITTIEESVFENNKLTNLTIPNQIINIENNSFKNNPLLNVEALSENPPSLGLETFTNVNTIDLTVRSSKIKTKYLAADIWKNFKNIISKGDSDEINDLFTLNNLVYKITSLVTKEVEVIGRDNLNQNIDIPEIVDSYSVTSIGNNAFDKNFLISVKLPNSIVNIGDFAFRSSNLSSIIIPENVTNIGKHAFIENKITSLIIPDKVSNIGSFAFWSNGLNNVTIGNGLETIDIGVFGMNKLIALNIPSKVNQILDNAFLDNPLTSVKSLNKTPPSIAINSFTNVSNIDLIVGSLASKATYKNTAIWKDFKSFVSNGTHDAIGDVFIDNNLKYSITSITPKTVECNEQIGNEKEIIIPNIINEFSVTSIGNDAFKNNQLTNIVLADNITKIGNSAFENNMISNIIIPDGVIEIGNNAFKNNVLEKLVLPKNLIRINNSILEDNKLTTINIPNNVKFIGDSAFKSNLLTNIIIPNNVNQIGNQTFKNNKLTSVTLSNTLTNLPDNSFEDNLLESLDIPNSITQIGNNAFTNNNISSVVVPNSVTSIGIGAFSNNSLTHIELPDNINSIQFASFSKNLLTNVTLPNSVINIDFGAFSDNLINNIKFSNNLVTIASSAFSNNLLTNLIIPKNLSNIGSSAFFNNPIKKVISLNDTPPKILPDFFGNITSPFDNIGNLELSVVSEEAKMSYETATIWKDFGNIIIQDATLSTELAEKNRNIDYSINNGKILIHQNNITVYQINIYNVNGAVLLKTDKNYLNIQNLPKGIYIMQIRTSNGQLTKKFAKRL